MDVDEIKKRILIYLHSKSPSIPVDITYHELLNSLNLPDPRLIYAFDVCIRTLEQQGLIKKSDPTGIQYYRITDEGRREALIYIRQKSAAIDRPVGWFGILVLVVVVAVFISVLVQSRNEPVKRNITNGDLVNVETNVLYIRRVQGMQPPDTHTCPVLKGAQLCVLSNPERINGELWFYVREIGGPCEGWIPERERGGRENVMYNSKCR